MADNPYVNKVVYGDQTIVDLTDATATASDIAQGATAYGASGELLTGTASGGGRCTWYGTSNTAAATAEKAVTCANFTLVEGAFIAVFFTTSNTAATPTLNVNSTGARSIYVGASAPSSTTNVLKWSANTVLYFVYDGTQFRYLGAITAASVQDPNGAGAWYGTANTAAGTAAKTTTITNFRLTKGAVVAVRFSTANTVSGAITLNVNSTGAKTIYAKSGATSSNNTLLWDANTTLLFVYSGSYWYYLGSDRDGGGSYTLPTASTSTKGGVKLPDDYSLWVDGDTLKLNVPPFILYYDGSTIYTSYADVKAALADGKTLCVSEWVTLGDTTNVTLVYPCYGVWCEDDGTAGAIWFRFKRWDNVNGGYVEYEADCFDDDTWNIIDLPPETAIERVSISLPSTNAGSNAANKTATITSSGYKAASIAGWTWASGGTRNNWFNFYRMDCDPTTGIVTVSACNTHASSAASGTVLVDVLLKRSDLI